MEIAAFVFSCLALPISLVSVAFVWRRDQRDKARRVEEERRHSWEHDRRHTERQPKLVGGSGAMSGGGWHRLWVELESCEALTALRVELPDDAGMAFPPGQDGVDNDEPWRATWGELATGRRAVWRLGLTDEKRRTVRVVVRCSVGDEQWPVPVDIETPRSPGRVWV